MSTYSNFLFEGEGCKPVLNDVTADSLIKDEDIKAAYEESSLEAGARCVMEATQNWNNIMRACTIQEFNYLEESGSELVYEGVILESFVDSVKKFFINLWEKIKSIFKKALMQFSSWTTSDKDFITKYKKSILAAANGELKKEDIEVSIYKDYLFLKDGFDKTTAGGENEIEKITYNGLDDIISGSNHGINLDVKGKSTDQLEDLKKINEAFDDDAINDIIEACRADVVQNIAKSSSYSFNDSSLTASEFTTELQNTFRGSDEKDDVKIADAVFDAIKFLENSKKIKSDLEKGLNNAKKTIDSAIKSVEKLQKDLSKGMTSKDNNTEGNDAGKIAGQQHTLVSKGLRILKATRSMVLTVNSVGLQELKNCSRQCKSVCVKVVSSAKVKKVGESGTVTTESSMSLLDGLELI